MFEMNGSMDSKELKFYVSPIKISFFPLEIFNRTFWDCQVQVIWGAAV